ncbi:FkbM family methyltransferase [Paenibacillus sp. 481]|uniref:FkbM family methyltransferase n=1 Tax=Paenibacillus sp. 481 TaxID=2835869 RepID=UPI001E42E741|nr:FkbM family methyltransferase [Paenibacillus sp. 481]UHA73153.1 FkbM family methyltransferase [Paenibacillus sp. 481]
MSLVTDKPMRIQLMQQHDISFVLDVGANIGQYALGLRNYGYEGMIVSFEPLENEFKQLHSTAQADEKWVCYNTALGNADTITELNVAGNSYSSSVLPMLKLHVDHAPESAYIGTQKAHMCRLDTLRDQLLGNWHSIYMKVDVQGYELEVIKGALRTLPMIKFIELELSLHPLYQGQPLFLEMRDYMHSLGYEFIYSEEGFKSSDSSEILQIDGIFVQRQLS